VLAPDELLDAIAGTLRRQVGPAVEEPFAKTQAFMAAVILEKLAGDLRVAAEPHDDGRAEVVVALRATLGDDAPARVAAAIDHLERDGTTAVWRELVEALYATRTELGNDRFAEALTATRTALRTRLDRSLAEQA